MTGSRLSFPAMRPRHESRIVPPLLPAGNCVKITGCSNARRCGGLLPAHRIAGGSVPFVLMVVMFPAKRHGRGANRRRR